MPSAPLPLLLFTLVGLLALTLALPAPARADEATDTPSVAAVLADGQGDFDPWNETRWAAWYRDGRLVKPFDIDRSLRFASRDGDWRPDLSGLAEAGVLFTVKKPGTVIDGNGLVIDVIPESHRNHTIDQLYATSMAVADIPVGLAIGFQFMAPLTPGVPDTQLHNLALKGFGLAIRAGRDSTHPLVVSLCMFYRNRTGIYINGTAVTATACGFMENANTASYNGSGSHHNRFIGNLFRDNNYRMNRAYGDLVLDTAYGVEIRNNQFLPSQATTTRHPRAAIGFFRNAGEDGRLREDYPRDNIIAENSIVGYSVGLNLATRQGRAEHGHDLAKEGRDYVGGNLIQGNSFRNTTIGIKVNHSGNTIEGNTFSRVTYPIVLHCVTYNLVGTTIRSQPNTVVTFWSTVTEYPDYAEWFPFQNPLMGSIPPNEKLFHVNSDGTAQLGRPGAAKLVVAPTLLTDASMTEIHSTGRQPIGLAVGDFYLNQPGDEVAVIWDRPSTKVGATTYYNIIFYDSDGNEINRSGRSTTKWAGLVAGKFTNGRGEQVAVFTERPVNGTYPVYVFRRGFKDPERVLLADNRRKIRALAAGNFDPSDDFEEIAVIFEDGTTAIRFAKPNDPTWSVVVESPVALAGIAGGKFDPAQEGAQVAAIGAAADPTSGNYPVYFFTPGTSGVQAVAAESNTRPWTAIGAGDFDPARAGEEVAVSGGPASGSNHPIQFLAPGDTAPRRTLTSSVMGVVPRVIASGKLPLRSTLTGYERTEGFPANATPDAVMADWGDPVVVLPSAQQAGAIPVFWIHADPADPDRRYLKVTPVIR